MTFLANTGVDATMVSFPYTNQPNAKYVNMQIKKTGSEDADISSYVDTVEDGLILTLRSDYTDVKTSEIINSNVLNKPFTAASISSQGENKGLNLRIASYNVALYVHNHTTTNLANDKIFGFRNLFSAVNPDIVGVQEDYEYIDRADTPNTQSAQNYIYNPLLPYTSGTGGVSIKSKIQPGSGKVLLYTSGRPLRYAIYTLSNSKTLLMVSTHPSGSADATSIREAEYTELFQWLDGETDLTEYGTSEGVHVPEADYKIICGDMNSIQDTDKTNLLNLISQYQFTSANGGRLGWLTTTPDELSLDNIICSNNIIINTINVKKTEGDVIYSDAYRLSDHYMLVCDLTLL